MENVERKDGTAYPEPISVKAGVQEPQTEVNEEEEQDEDES